MVRAASSAQRHDRRLHPGVVEQRAILGVLRSALAQVGARLMDAVDPALGDRATDALSTTEGVKGSANCGCVGSATGCGPKPTSRPTLA